LKADGAYLLSVGHLIERKGHHIAIEALRHLPGVQLLIAGAGPELGALQQQAKAQGVADRVRFVGLIAQDDLAWWYSAADALALCSSREGWANVLLESMACGTPVLATNIWGTPEVVTCAAAGRLLEARDPEALARAWQALQADRPSAQATRAHAEGFSWDSTTQGQLALFERIRAQGVAA
jgi:glycosyltransferase involved in cell wall biosynthesis